MSEPLVLALVGDRATAAALALGFEEEGVPLTVRIAQGPPDAHAANKRLGRGLNLANALEAPKEGEWGVTLKAEYFRAIKQAGFDSVGPAGSTAPAGQRRFTSLLWTLQRAL